MRWVVSDESVKVCKLVPVVDPAANDEGMDAAQRRARLLGVTATFDGVRLFEILQGVLTGDIKNDGGRGE